MSPTNFFHSWRKDTKLFFILSKFLIVGPIDNYANGDILYI